MKRIVAVALMITLASGAAWALDLQSARAAGKVCEKGDGYIAAAGKSDAEVSALVASVNAGRKTYYQRLAKEKGQSVDAVAKVAAGPIISEGNKACR
jgi:uncharacterized protein